MIRVNHSLEIPESDLEWAFVLSSGPGGQHVNTSATAAQLTFALDANETLPPRVKHRLRTLAGTRLTDDGRIRITAQRTRSQKRNRDDALERLLDLIRQAAAPVRKRRPTRPTQGSKERRIQAKKRRSDIKKHRRPPRRDGV